MAGPGLPGACAAVTVVVVTEPAVASRARRPRGGSDQMLIKAGIPDPNASMTKGRTTQAFHHRFAPPPSRPGSVLDLRFHRCLVLRVVSSNGGLKDSDR